MITPARARKCLGLLLTLLGCMQSCSNEPPAAVSENGQSDAARAGAPGGEVPNRDDQGAAKSPRTSINVEGRILDQLGTPLARVRVRAEPDNGAWFLDSTDLQAEGASRSGQRDPETETGPEGRFRLRVSTRLAATVRILARHPQFEVANLARQVTLDRDRDLGDHVLRTGAGLLVEVRNDASSAPIANATVALTRVLHPADRRPSAPTRGERTVATDPSGVATFFAVEPTAWHLRTFAAGYRTAEIIHQQPTNPTTPPRVTVRLTPGAVLSGQFLDPTGKPIADAQIWATPRSVPAESKAAAPLRPASTRSDDDGRFRLSGLAPGPHRVVARGPDGAWLIRNGIEPGNGSLALQLPTGFQVAGTVLDPSTRRPVIGARVAAEPLAGWPGWELGTPLVRRTRTDADGNFRFRGIPAGIIRIVAESEGFGPGVLGPLRLGPPSTDRSDPLPEPILLDSGCSIRGKVLGPAGTPVEDAMIQTVQLPTPSTGGRSAAGHRWRMQAAELLIGVEAEPAVRTDAGGRFRLALPPGHFRLRVQGHDLPATYSPVFEAKAGGRNDLTAIRLRRGGTIAGRAQSRDGTPAAGATVYLRPVPGSQGPGAMGICDDAGHFQLPAGGSRALPDVL